MRGPYISDVEVCRDFCRERLYKKEVYMNGLDSAESYSWYIDFSRKQTCIIGIYAYVSWYPVINKKEFDFCRC